MKISVKNINKKYDQELVLKELSLEIRDGEMMVLLGPSGCGKSTLLRIISGLTEATSGDIYFDERKIDFLPPQKRNTAMVFQSYALFPHLTVFENIAFGLKVRKVSRQEIRNQVLEIMGRVDLAGLENRKIQELSGGQRQRVALARALITKPDSLLFDEPLSNLDEQLRVNMRQYIRKLQKEFHITSIYVTHDQEEAMALADRITILEKGVIQQVGTAGEIYNHPANVFVAEFIGRANLFDATGGETSILGKKLPLPSPQAKYAMLRPEKLLFSKDGYPATISLKENLGAFTQFELQAGEKTLQLDSFNSSEVMDLKEGDPVRISYDESAVVFLEE